MLPPLRCWNFTCSFAQQRRQLSQEPVTSEAGPCALRPPHKPSLGEMIGAKWAAWTVLWHDVFGDVHAPGLQGATWCPGAGPSQRSSLSLAEWKVLYLESGFIVLFSLLERAVHSRAGIKGCPWGREATSCRTPAGTRAAPGAYPKGSSELCAGLTSDLGVGLISRVDQQPPVCP